MAIKIALLAALCAATAFAFPPSSEGLVDEVAAGSLAHQELDIVMGCFALQKYNLLAISKKVAEVAQIVVEGLEEELRETAEESLRQTEKPVARIGLTLLNIHEDMYTHLYRLDVLKAYEALAGGIRTIDGILGEIREGLNKVKVEHPELTDAMDWYMRTIVFKMEVFIPQIRRDFGGCLYRGRPSV